MPISYCDCCRTRTGQRRQLSVRRQAVARYATLCHDCATLRHTEQACLVCPEPALHWHCARVAHFAAAHPGVLEQLRNDPFPELQPQAPALRKLGTLRLPG